MERLEPCNFEEDSQTGFSTDAPPTFPDSEPAGSLSPLAVGSEQAAAVHSSAARPEPSPGAIRLRKSLVLSLGMTLALSMSLSAREPHTASARPPGDSEAAEVTQEEETRNQRWRAEEVTLALDSSLDALPSDVRESIRSSFVTWEDTGAALPTIRFVETEGAVASLKPDGQSTVLYAPIEFEGHESDLAITIGFSNPNTGEISEADIVINSKHLSLIHI